MICAALAFSNSPKLKLTTSLKNVNKDHWQNLRHLHWFTGSNNTREMFCGNSRIATLKKKFFFYLKE